MSDQASPPPLVGRMTIELYDHGALTPTPVVTFDPVGRFTPGLLDQHMMHFCQQIQIAHAAERNATRNATMTQTPAAPPRRKSK